jgi:NADPH:quinone reductase-like Zn-dependent oxidoreductase
MLIRSYDIQQLTSQNGEKMTRKMRAIVYEEYGPPDVLQLREVEKPVPGANQVLIQVQATTVTKYDCWMRSCTAPPGFDLLMRVSSGRKPKKPILGTELSGEVESVGPGVTRFQAGDPVFAYPGMNLGACAEYICLPEESVAIKPANLNHEQAAAVLQGALTALFFLRKANLQPGQEILIFGASGGVGSYAVQLARHHFAAQVTGVCSPSKLGFVKSLGADRVVDYTHEDFTQNGQLYDILFDTVGKTSVSRSKKSLKKSGCYLLATFSLPMLYQLLWLSLTSSLKVVYGALNETNEDLIFIRRMIEEGVLIPVVDRCYPLEQTTEAHRYVESGSKTGSVVISVQNSDSGYTD